MQAFADVQALVFDVFGTVVDWRSGVARESAPFLARHAPGADPAAFADAWRRLYSPAMEEVRSGRRPFVRLDVLHRENLEAVLPEFGIDRSAVPPSELDALNLAWRWLDPWPDSVPGLARLKRRFIIAPLSNGNVRLMLDMAKRAGLPWDAILGAELAQAYKPAPEAYLRTAEFSWPGPSKSASSPLTMTTSRRRAAVAFEPLLFPARPSMDRVRPPTLPRKRIGTHRQTIWRISRAALACDRPARVVRRRAR